MTNTVRCGGWFFESGVKIPSKNSHDLANFLDLRKYKLSRFTSTETIALALRLLETPIAANYDRGMFYIRAFQPVGETLKERDVTFGIGLPGEPNIRELRVFITNLSHRGRGAPRRSNIVSSAFYRLNEYLLTPFENSEPKVDVIPIYRTNDYYEIVKSENDGEFVVLHYNAIADRYFELAKWTGLYTVMSKIAEGTHY